MVKSDHRSKFYASLAGLLLCASATQADVRLPKVLGDHMVLQRDIAARVWGRESFEGLP